MVLEKKDFIQLSGELYTAVQSSGIFEDSKTFVDSIPKIDPNLIREHYQTEKNKKSFDLKKFIISNFILPEETKVAIDLPEKRTMREHIQILWQVLKREALSEVSKHSTLIPIPNPYIIPGGRFREIYYWDSYFTLHGLLADGEIETVENMIDNFSYLIEETGFIPNGNRVYYLSRSQPPFFAPMIDLVCRFKNDYARGLKYLHVLEKEYSFWCSHNTKEGSNIRIVKLPDGKFLNRYFDSEKLPREESYLEDIQTAQSFTAEEKTNLYQNIRSACESGWDFSSRWFRDEKSLSACVASDILPVDLNSLLYFAESLISKLNNLMGDKNKSQIFSQSAKNRAELINKIFWDEKQNFYFDYNWKDQKRTKVYSLAACYPLYFNIAEKEMAESVKEKIETDFLRDGGVLTTLNFVGQQWDAPNGWAPLQWIAIKGLRNYGFDDLAEEIKQRWISLNEKVFKSTGKMFEKYNVEDISLHAGGGEYPLQDGFGWTNGIASALLSNLDEELY
jgi:alpha,alpha-trehalase